MAIIDGFCTGETSLATSRYQIGLLAAAAIVALRVGIGLHFYLEGAAKLQNPKPFSAGFLGSAKGPLADSYKQMVWDADGLYRLNYNYIQPHWDHFRNRITAHYHFDEAQAAKATEIFNDYTRRYSYLRQQQGVRDRAVLRGAETPRRQRRQPLARARLAPGS